jgi:hypothetical protein
MSTPHAPDSKHQPAPLSPRYGRIVWASKLRHFLQVLVFTLVVATLQYAFRPEIPYGPPLVYSVLIGSITWAVIDIGREFFPSSRETGWPRGWANWVLVLGGIGLAYFAGTAAANALCTYYGLYPEGIQLANLDEAEKRSSLLITLMAGAVGSYYFYTLNQGVYFQRKMSEAREQATEARLKLLETQLEPHMLFNTLANLRVLIATEPQRAQVMLDHMIAYLRATLGASRATTHTLAAEFDRLRDYLELMAIRMGPRLSFSLDLPDSLARLAVPTLLLQPLVENSIRHALEPKVEGGRIVVTAHQQDGRLVLEVRDTGRGLKDLNALREGKTGFGIAQVRERLQTSYGPAASLEFSRPTDGGTCAALQLPLVARVGSVNRPAA